MESDGAVAIAAPVLWGVAAFLLGGILWGAVIARLYGVDIRTVGTRNPGAANVWRSIGWLPGLAAFLADALTGAVAVFVPQWLPNPSLGMAAGTAGVVLGNLFSPFWGFRGGAGLAKGVGVALGLNPLGFAIAAVAALLIVVRFRNNGIAGGVLLAGTVLHALVTRDFLAVALILLTGAVLFGRVIVQAKRHPAPAAAEPR